MTLYFSYGFCFIGARNLQEGNYVRTHARGDDGGDCECTGFGSRKRLSYDNWTREPILFVIVPDPIRAGFVDSLARRGGNSCRRGLIM